MNDETYLIVAYTREQAIADGVLIDVTETAKQAGFVYPVALTNGVWAEYVVVPKEVSWQDETGRLWDILNMLHFAIKTSKEPGSELLFKVFVCNSEPDPYRARSGTVAVKLKSLCGPGDNGEAVITIMLPEED